MDEMVDNEIKTDICPKMTKFQVIKNLCVICVGTIFFVTCWYGLGMLQSTMNREQGVGVTGAAILFGCMSLSSLLFPKYVISKLGSKRTLVLSWLSGLPYAASNFYPHWAMIIPTSVLMGIGASLMWSSISTYLSDISVLYADLKIASSRHSSRANSNDVHYKRKSGNAQEYEHHECVCKCYLCSPPQRIMDEIRRSENLNCKSVDPQNARKCSLTSIQSLPIWQDLCLSDDKDIARNSRTIQIKNSEDCHTEYEEYKAYCELFKSNEPSITPKLQTQQNQDKLIARSKIIESTAAVFFGFHGMAFLSCYFWGNLLSYFVLRDDVVYEHLSNSSCLCGANFCNVASNCSDINLEPPSDNIRFILTGAYVCLGLLACLSVALFVDPLESSTKKEVSLSLNLLMATFKIAKTKELILLIPSSFYIGLAQGFYEGDFTKSYIGCAWGTYHIGLVSICYGLSCAVFSPLSGWFVRQLGRRTVFSSAAVVNLATNIYLLIWEPDNEEIFIFFIVAGLWGVILGAILPQLRAFHGMLFKEDEEAAFSAFNMWYSLGHSLSFAYTNYFCTSVKIYVLLAVSSVGFTSYLIVERWHQINKTKK